jgi:hypothetical protein
VCVECFHSASFGKFDIVKLLVSNGFNTDYIAEGAGRSNYVDILSYCLKNNFNLTNQVFNNASEMLTPLSLRSRPQAAKGST